MRAMLAAVLVTTALLTTPSRSQDVPGGSQGVTAPGDTSGSQAGSRRKGKHGAEQKASNQAPRADDKDYRSSLERLPNQKYDPWRDMR